VRISTRGALARFDPLATPGIVAVEAQGAPPRAGLAEPPGGDELLGLSNGSSTADAGTPARPRSLRWPVSVEVPALPGTDSYSLRLVSSRRLYDHGVLVGACHSLAPLASPPTLRANSHELGLLGVATSARIRVRSSRGALELTAVADDSVPRGVVCVDFNLHGDAPGDEGDERAGASALIDASGPVVDVRLETV